MPALPDEQGASWGCYENYFQVFWGFSKKSYPEIYNDSYSNNTDKQIGK